MRTVLTLVLLFSITSGTGYEECKVHNYLRKYNKDMYSVFGKEWLSFDDETRRVLKNNKDKFYR